MEQNILRNAWKHFGVVTRHKRLIRRYCFRVGLYKQGILHDLSKYSPTEFLVGCRYFQGNRSPNNAEREDHGCSLAWLHHKGRNKHHYEYWIDYSIEHLGEMAGMKMPVKYVVEMFIDRIAASKIYLKEAYTDGSPLEYYHNGKPKLIHKDTEKLLTSLLLMLSEKGEEKTFDYIRREVLKNKK